MSDVWAEVAAEIAKAYEVDFFALGDMNRVAMEWKYQSGAKMHEADVDELAAALVNLQSQLQDSRRG